jgi:PhnB protein
MAIRKLNPYLNFNGTADKAIELYRTALGAKVEQIMRFGDVADMKAGPEHKDRIMHAVLRIGEGTIMASDTMPDRPIGGGGAVQVTLDFDDPVDMGRRFEALSSGGTITFPLHDAFWGAKFGMLTDAFGVQWMFNCDVKRG